MTPKVLRFRNYHFTTKAGPNGHALGRFLDDLESLPESLRKSISIVGGDKLSDRMSILLKESSYIRSDGSLQSPKPEEIYETSLLSEMEGKVRYVAELDYFSQAALKPLHR